MSLQYNLVNRDGYRNVTVFVDGQMLTADENHPAINEIVDAVVNGHGEAGIANLFDASIAAARRFEKLTDVVSVANSRVYVDGDEVDDVYADLIIRFMQEGSDFMPLVKFLEKTYTNNEQHSRENLSRWLNATGGFTIDEDGDIRGYKGVRADLTSITAGPGIVNGESVSGHLDNSVGNVVEMARSKVQHNPSVGCSVGLHVGTWEYASNFGHGTVVEVKVNPRDVVSVPTDCNGQKMRTCRYKVVSVVNAPHDTAYVGRHVDDYYDYDDEPDPDDYYNDDYDF